MSGFWPTTDDATTQLQPQIASGPPTELAENFSAARQDMIINNNPLSMYDSLTGAYQQRIDEAYQKTGKRLVNPFLAEPVGIFKDVVIPGGSQNFRKKQISDFETEIEKLRAEHPDLMSQGEMIKRLNTRAVTAEDRATDVGDRATLSGKVGSVAGMIEGAVQDPFTLVTLPFGAARGAGLLRTALTEGGIAGGAQLLSEPQVQTSRIERGQEGGVVQGAENVAGAAAGGFVIGGAVHGISTLMGRKLLNRFDKTVKNPTAAQKEARDIYGRIVDINESSPLDSSIPGAIEEHHARLDAAMRSLDAGDVPSIPDRPAAAISPKILAGNMDNLDGVLFKFNPSDIATDAKTFQFKEGGDVSGVTERLKGIKTWDPVKAGQVLVFEDAAGKQFIADGHQRLGLAQRIQAADPEAQIPLYGHLFKQEDGYTPEMVRVIAAMKNIAEGTGSAVDAAKVLRVAPERIGELPPNSALVRQAGDMVNLSDNAFGMVINDVVPANYAAVVGRLVPDNEPLQGAIMDVLSKTDPANVTQAEAIVRQAMDAGTKTEIQGGLFGDEAITTSLFSERAKVLDKGLKKLRQDAKVFDTLVRNEDNIAAEGNILSRDANEARAQTDARAVQMIQTLANRKGPLSDALSQAARRAADDGKYTGATSDFIAAVRSAIERGDFDGLPSGGAGRGAENEAQNAARAGSAAEARPSEESLKLFDEPGGTGAEAQTRALDASVRSELAVDKTPVGNQLVIPGAEKISDKELIDILSDEKLQPVVEQLAADHGLFDQVSRAQPDLLDQHIPAALQIDPETGKISTKTQTIREMLDEIDRDAADLDAIGKCGKP